VPKLQTVGQVCTFLRWQRGFPIPSSAAFGQIGERYTKAVERFAKEHGIPVVHFEKGQNKEDLARPLIEAAARAGKDQVVLIGIAQEKASAWRSWKAKGQENAKHPHMEWGRQMAIVNHFYFYLWDSDWGEVEVDETFVGGVEEGGAGRHAGEKALVVIAAEVRGRGTGRIRLGRVLDASAASLLPFVRSVAAPGSKIITDGWKGYGTLLESGYGHRRLVQQGNEHPDALLPRATEWPRCSSAGSSEPTKARSSARTFPTTSMSSRSASTDERRVSAACCSTVSSSRHWP
jgi:transposase-like protein